MLENGKMTLRDIELAAAGVNISLNILRDYIEDYSGDINKILPKKYPVGGSFDECCDEIKALFEEMQNLCKQN